MRLPDLRQKDGHSCGDVARTVALLAAGWPKRFVRSLPPIATPEHGVPPRRLALLLRRNGVNARLRRNLTLAGAAKLMPAHVLICPVAGQNNGHNGHWITLQGVGLQMVTYHDPLCGTTSKSRLDFLDWWYDRDHRGEEWPTSAVVVPRYVPPA